jgi:hypothetical protein
MWCVHACSRGLHASNSVQPTACLPHLGSVGEGEAFADRELVAGALVERGARRGVRLQNCEAQGAQHEVWPCAHANPTPRAFVRLPSAYLAPDSSVTNTVTRSPSLAWAPNATWAGKHAEEENRISRQAGKVPQPPLPRDQSQAPPPRACMASHSPWLSSRVTLLHM